MVIEITDPDCPFCRQASAFFSGRNDVTRHIFLYPLSSIHPNAEAKVRHIFCADDRARAYEEAMAGKLDDMKFTPCQNGEADNLLKAHKEIGDRVGVAGTGTPLFLIDGQEVKGINRYPAIAPPLPVIALSDGRPLSLFAAGGVTRYGRQNTQPHGKALRQEARQFPRQGQLNDNAG
jgi:hypothetical protein